MGGRGAYHGSSAGRTGHRAGLDPQEHPSEKDGAAWQDELWHEAHP